MIVLVPAEILEFKRPQGQGPKEDLRLMHRTNRLQVTKPQHPGGDTVVEGNERVVTGGKWLPEPKFSFPPIMGNLVQEVPPMRPGDMTWKNREPCFGTIEG